MAQQDDLSPDEGDDDEQVWTISFPLGPLAQEPTSDTPQQPATDPDYFTDEEHDIAREEFAAALHGGVETMREWVDKYKADPRLSLQMPEPPPVWSDEYPEWARKNLGVTLTGTDPEWRRKAATGDKVAVAFWAILGAGFWWATTVLHGHDHIILSYITGALIAICFFTAILTYLRHVRR